MVDFAKGDGLVPVIVQDATTFQVLMLGYMNEEALKKTEQENVVTFFSRSKQRLWTKGETSGNTLTVKKIFVDCDDDTILILVDPVGPVCHKGTVSCFAEDQLDDARFLGALEKIIADRAEGEDGSSYTAKLLSEGVKRISQKVGEEGTEVALAAVAGDDEELLNECADLLYHLSVLLRAKQRSLNDVGELLARRHRK